MQRRDFMKIIGGAAASWPLAARAQQRERMRRVGVLMALAADDPESQVRIAGFLQGLQQLNWTVGRNLRIDYRWGASNNEPERVRRYAAELIALEPDVVLAGTGSIVQVLRQQKPTVPIVAAAFIDPVANGSVDSLARPGGNVTGFASAEYSMSGKLLELLKQIAPGVTRVGVLRDPSSTAGAGQFGAIQAVAPSFGSLELRPIDSRDAETIERGVAAFARGPNNGLIVPASALATIHRELLIALAERYRLPTVYPVRYFAASGGLISYGPDLTEQYRLAAGYVDRILKGENPADLPVQAPTKYELVINLKTAKALGLQIPDVVRARADEVIE